MQTLTRILLLLVLLTGCTTTLYTGQFTATDSTGKEQPFVLYWNATKPFLGSSKASPVTLLPCYPRTIQFEEQPAPVGVGSPTWIVFRGEPGQDQPSAAVPQLADGICGRIVGKSRLSELGAPALELMITCEASAGDEFSAAKPYLKAQSEPYRIEIKQRESKDLARDTPSRALCN